MKVASGRERKTILELLSIIPENLDLIKSFNLSLSKFLTNHQTKKETSLAAKL